MKKIFNYTILILYILSTSDIAPKNPMVHKIHTEYDNLIGLISKLNNDIVILFNIPIKVYTPNLIEKVQLY